MTEEETRPRQNWNRPIAGPQSPSASHQVAVYGKSAEQAYSRRAFAKPVTFVCVVCGQEKTEYRYPGFKSKDCSDTCYSQDIEERRHDYCFLEQPFGTV